MSFTVLLMTEAIEALDETVAYYESYSSSKASEWLCGLEAVVTTLESDPHRFPVASQSDVVGRSFREALFGANPQKPTHRLLYVIDSDVVRVLAIRHHAQDRWRG